MFASGTGSMRGPRAKTPLLLLLLLLSTLTGTVSCQEEETEPETPDEEVDETETEPQSDPEEPVDGNDPEITTTVSDDTPGASPSPAEEDIENTSEIGEDQGSGLGQSISFDAFSTESTLGPDFTGSPPTGEPGEDEGLSFIIILIPVVLVVVIIGMIVCGIFINRRWNQKVRSQELRKEDPYLDGSSTEKVPMPMFEEDVPSVLELEMEELGQWMKKDDDSKLA